MSYEVNAESLLASLQKSLAMIIFDRESHVLRVNQNFAKTMEYEVDEMIGLHHRNFCLPEFATSPAYTDFWNSLRNGNAFQDKIVRVTKTGKRIVLEATYQPIFNESGDVEAIVKVATDITKRETVLRDGTSELMAMVEEMTANTDEVLLASERMTENMNHLNSETNTVKTFLTDIESVVDFVQHIASQSNLLGLNAAIEAARAGEHGRGFQVVANEIRNMADSSKKSSEEISELLASVSTSISTMVENLHTVTNQVQANFLSINELKRAYDHIAATTEKLAATI